MWVPTASIRLCNSALKRCWVCLKHRDKHLTLWKDSTIQRTFVKWFWRYPIGRIIFERIILYSQSEKSLAQQPTVFSAGETRHIGPSGSRACWNSVISFCKYSCKTWVFGTFVCWSFHSLKTLDLVMECINKSRPFSVDVILGIEYVCKKTTTSKNSIQIL